MFGAQATRNFHPYLYVTFSRWHVRREQTPLSRQIAVIDAESISETSVDFCETS